MFLRSENFQGSDRGDMSAGPRHGVRGRSHSFAALTGREVGLRDEGCRLGAQTPRAAT